MTLEYSLRRRATQSRSLAMLWLCLAVSLLIVTYLTLPYAIAKTFSSVNSWFTIVSGTASKFDSLHEFYYVMSLLIIGLLVISFACYLLGRSAFVEMELAARTNGLADALCVSGDSMDNLEKAVKVFIPKDKYFTTSTLFSKKDVDALMEVARLLRKPD